MSQAAAKLIVELVGKDADLRRAFAQADKDGSVFSANMQRYAGGAAAGFGFLATSALATAAAINSVALENGTLARELSGQAAAANASVIELQAFRHAVRDVGLEEQKAGEILKDFQDKIGDLVGNEGGEFKGFFDNVAEKAGITAEKLQILSGPQALIALKEGMDDANVSAAEQRNYLESIADDTSKLIPLLQDGGEGYRRLRKDFLALNTVMTDAEITKYKAYAEDVDGLGAAFSAITREAVTPFVNELQEGAHWLTDLLSKGRKNMLADRINTLHTEMVELNEEIQDIEANAKNYGGGLDGMWDSWMGQGNKASRIKARREELAQIRKDLAEAQEHMAQLNGKEPDFNGREGPDLPVKGYTGGDDERDKARASSESALAAMDMQFADESQRLWLQHQTRVAQIEQAQLSEAEIKARGYESLKQLQADYQLQSLAHYEAEIDAGLLREEQQQLRKEEQDLAEIERIRQQLLSKEEVETEAWQNRQTMLADAFARNLIEEEKYQKLSTKNWDNYQKQIAKMEAQRAAEMYGNTSDLFGGMADLTKAFGGEQSGLFKAMFAASKAFAIAESMIKIQQGIANAASLPFPANLAAMGSVVSATAGIVSSIKGTELPKYHTGGIAGMPADNYSQRLANNEVMTVLQQGEEVLTQQDPRHRFNASGRSGAMVVNIHQNGSDEVRVEQSGPNQLEVYVEAARNAVAQDFAQGGNDIADSAESAYGLQRQAMR